jgi:hypothetical protein
MNDVAEWLWLDIDTWLIIFGYVDNTTFMTSIPRVCRRWRTICTYAAEMIIDFNALFFPYNASFAKMCMRFPWTTTVTLCGSKVNDGHVMALATHCPGITHATFRGCVHLTNAAAFALASKCNGLVFVDFGECRMTHRMVSSLMRKFPGLGMLYVPLRVLHDTRWYSTRDHFGMLIDVDADEVLTADGQPWVEPLVRIPMRITISAFLNDANDGGGGGGAPGPSVNDGGGTDDDEMEEVD